MTYTKDQLVEALYNEYVFLCHDDFDPDNDATPEEYLEMLKEMSCDELIGETSTDDIQEVYTRIQSRGSTYSIILNWRGKYLSVQMFFPQFSRPPKDQVTYEVRKIYPGAIVLTYNPSAKDPTKPLLFTGDENESRRH